MHRRAVALAIASLALATPALAASEPRVLAGPPQFADTCLYSHTNRTDPILDPGGRNSHRHEFFANITTNHLTTPATLRAAPDSTCLHRQTTDKSAYWIPALTVPDGRGGFEHLKPYEMRIYYRPGIEDAESVQPFHEKHSMIAGNAVATQPQDLDILEWSCIDYDGERDIVQSIPDGCADSPTIDDPTEEFAGLRMTLFFPSCWDGYDDFPWGADTLEHMAYSVPQPNGDRVCPEGFDIPVPEIEVGARWDVTVLDDVDGLIGAYLSSDDRHGSGIDGITGHADFMNGWDQEELGYLVANCLNARVHCGNGRG